MGYEVKQGFKMDKQIAVSLNNVSFKYNQDWALKNIDLNIYKNEFLGVVGPNGGGKTTLLKIILGLLKPNRGTVKTYGLITYVPQHLAFDKYFPITVLDLVLMGLLDELKNGVLKTSEHVEKANLVLKQLGISKLAKKKFGELSGGQRQRTLIARAIINDPQILVLDEPTANIDKEAQNMVHSILAELKNKITIIMVSHNFDYIVSDVDRVACINKTLHMHSTLKTELDNISLIDHSSDKNGLNQDIEGKR
jgi:zinc transport system ATP-binding protein